MYQFKQQEILLILVIYAGNRILLHVLPQLVEYLVVVIMLHAINDFGVFASTGDAQDFGDLLQLETHGGSVSDSVGLLPREEFHLPKRRNVIDFFTMSSSSNAQDFGDVQHGIGQAKGMHNS